MTAEGAIEFEALEAQAARLMNLFVEAGYERVAPAFIQPASLFLDRIGESLRARTYVFIDPNGEELCLRPDLTLPVARVFLERAAPLPAKFCYNGPAFRMQDGKPDPLRPREFRQAGVEYFGGEGNAADAEVFALTLNAVRDSGLGAFAVRVGHLGLFTAFLHALDIPSRWRDRLAHAFWRPQAFARLLTALSRKQDRVPPSLPASALTEDGFLDHIDAENIPFIGLRRPFEIVKRLNDKVADAGEAPLGDETIRLIEDYIRVAGPVSKALPAIEALTRRAGLHLSAAIGEARALFQELERTAKPAPLLFSADFGRHFEYYTGMVFQIEAAGAGVSGHLGGGGRYDGLLSALSGGDRDVPAVGAAIHTERLLSAVSRR